MEWPSFHQPSQLSQDTRTANFVSHIFSCENSVPLISMIPLFCYCIRSSLYKHRSPGIRDTSRLAHGRSGSASSVIRTQHFLLRCGNRLRQPHVSLIRWKRKIRNRRASGQTQSRLPLTGRRQITMYESFFGLTNTPFVRDIPAEKLYESDAFRETLGRLCYAADRQMSAGVTADPGCGKSTLIRRFYSELPREKYIILYLSDSKLTPRWFYKGMLDQLGLESRLPRRFQTSASTADRDHSRCPA